MHFNFGRTQGEALDIAFKSTEKKRLLTASTDSTPRIYDAYDPACIGLYEIFLKKKFK